MKSFHAVSCKVIIFNEDYSKVLLCDYGPDGYGLVGGHLEAGESPDNAIRRELHEETGLQDLENFMHFDFLQHKNGKVILLYSGVTREDAKLSADGDEVKSLIWIDASDVHAKKYNVGCYQSILERAFNLAS